MQPVIESDQEKSEEFVSFLIDNGYADSKDIHLPEAVENLKKVKEEKSKIIDVKILSSMKESLKRKQFYSSMKLKKLVGGYTIPSSEKNSVEKIIELTGQWKDALIEGLEALLILRKETAPDNMSRVDIATELVNGFRIETDVLTFDNEEEEFI